MRSRADSVEASYLYADPRSETFSFNIKEMMVWNEQPDLTIPKYKHTCGVIKLGKERIVIAAGGIDDIGLPVNIVETLVVTEVDGGTFHFANEWEYGPNLPEVLQDGASATTSDGQAVFIIGGTILHGSSSGVLKFYCTDGLVQQCSWTKVDYELAVPTATGLALMMPQLPMPHREYPNAKDCPEGKRLAIFVLNFLRDIGISSHISKKPTICTNCG